MAEPGPRAADAAARAAALEVATSFIVQAPAGSGKTTLLTQRYLTLLAGVERPEAIIAITFTQKAAAEMRERVLKALAGADAGTPPKDEAEATTRVLASQVLARAAERGWSLVEQPARLRIQTIDSLCHWLAERLPIVSRSGGSLVVEPRAAPLYRLAAERTLAAIGGSGPLADALAVALAHLGNEAERLVALLAEMLATRERWLRVVVERDAQALRTVLEDSLAELVGNALARCRAAIPDEEGLALAPLLRGAQQRIQAGGGLPAPEVPPWPWPTTGESLALWQRLALACLTKDDRAAKRSWRQKVDKRNGFPTEAAEDRDAFVALLARLAAVPGLHEALARLPDLPPARLGEGEWQVIAALGTVLLAGATELGAVCAERGVVDFQAVGAAALEALGRPDDPTDLTIALDGRIEHLLVDEFQDTSAAQVELLRRLTAGWSTGDGRTLFLVGDPMQSIYRFREADVGQFLQVRAEGLGGVALAPLVLESNFRSRPGVVEWVNATFAPVLPTIDAPDLGAVRYAPSLASRAALAGTGVEWSVLPGATPADEARRVVELVQREQAANPQARIAVLARSRAHLAQVAAALAAAGIRFQGVDLVPLGERPAIRDLVALTRALLHAGDRVAWLACLRAPWCGLELGELEQLVAGDLQPVPALLGDATRRAALAPAPRARLEATLRVLEAARAERGRRGLGAWVESAWLALGGPATLAGEADLADVRAFLARLDLLSRAGDLEDPPALAAALEELYAAPDPAAPATLQLLTIHKAKGLEWDVVILPGLGRGVRGQSRRLLELLQFAREGGRPGLVLAPHRARAEDPAPLEAWLRELDRARGGFELGRLLYVAATRARERLHLVTHLLVDGDGEPKAARTGSMLATLWPGVGDAVLAVAATAQPAVPAAPPVAGPQRLERLPAGWRAPPPRAALVPLPSPRRSTGPTAFEFEWVTNVARHVGSVVHEEFERLVKEALPVAGALTGREPAWSRRLGELGVDAMQLPVAVARVRAALEATARDARGAWVLDPGHAASASELELATPVRGQVRSARIDRTFIDADGTRWIIDFKTSAHEGTDLDAFLDREVQRYQAQLEQYAALMAEYDPGRPVRLGLYFAMLGAWREWAAGAPLVD